MPRGAQRAGAHRRQGDRQGDRRAWQARESRRPLGVGAAPYTRLMPATLKPAYLVHGDDHGAIAERRAEPACARRGAGRRGQRRGARWRGGAPAGVALALATMTFAIGQRVIVVDGVERWKEAEVQEHARAGAGRACRPTPRSPSSPARRGAARRRQRLHKAVKRRRRADRGAGHRQALGAAASWVREQAGRLGLALDAAAAKALVAQVGERQQRLLRELEKLALELAPSWRRPQAVRARSAPSRSSRAPRTPRAARLRARRRPRRRRSRRGDVDLPAACASRASASPGSTYLMAQPPARGARGRAAAAGRRVRRRGCAQPADAAARRRASRRRRQARRPRAAACCAGRARRPRARHPRRRLRCGADRSGLASLRRTRSRCGRSRRSAREADLRVEASSRPPAAPTEVC